MGKLDIMEEKLCLDLLDQMEEIRQMAADGQRISSVDAIEECICILLQAEDDCETAFDVLMELQDFKEDEENSLIHSPVDYCIRHCCSVFAKAAGFSCRNEWLNLMGENSKHYMRLLRGCYVA